MLLTPLSLLFVALNVKCCTHSENRWKCSKILPWGNWFPLSLIFSLCISPKSRN